MKPRPSYKGMLDQTVMADATKNMANGGHSIGLERTHGIMHVGSTVLRDNWQGPPLEYSYHMRKQVWAHEVYWHVKLLQEVTAGSGSVYFLWFTLLGEYSEEEAHRAARTVIDLANINRKESL